MPYYIMKKEERRKAIDTMATLIASESHYAPYDDRELADKTGLSVSMVRYYRHHYLGKGSRIDRRAAYLNGEPTNECKQQSERESPTRKAAPKAKRTTRAKKGES